jgi:hypothetical protein
LPTIDETNIQRKHDEHSHWHSISLVFVALPAIAGLVFENGSAVMTDILLLSLGCLFLYWSVKWPFQWYHSTQERVYLMEDEDEISAEEDFVMGDESMQEDRQINGQNTSGEQAGSPVEDSEKPTSTKPSKVGRKQSEAVKSLRNLELAALASCFISPMAVAYLLHAIRPYLSRPSGGLVSNSNLTLFVLAAEVRPVAHVLKLIESRTLHLQKSITEYPTPISATEKVDYLLERISTLEAKQQSILSNETPATDDLTSAIILEAKEPAEASSSKPSGRDAQLIDADTLTASIKSSIQPQLDALNRAVRRYEKRATTQSVLLEARLHDLDLRINDALSLAAAASRMAQQKPVSFFFTLFQLVSQFSSWIVLQMWTLVLLPWRLLTATYVYFIGAVTPSRSTAKPLPKKKADAAANPGVLGRGKGTEKSAAVTGSATATYLSSVVTRGRIFGKA